MTLFGHSIELDVQNIDEWRLLACSLGTLDVNSDMSPEIFWSKVGSPRQMDNNLMFPNLSKFMQSLCLPHSSTTVEIFFLP